MYNVALPVFFQFKQYPRKCISYASQSAYLPFSIKVSPETILLLLYLDSGGIQQREAQEKGGREPHDD